MGATTDTVSAGRLRRRRERDPARGGGRIEAVGGRYSPLDGDAVPVRLISGDIPSPSNPPTGCHFHPRCPQAMEVCRQRYPEARTVGDGRVVSCHLVDSMGG